MEDFLLYSILGVLGIGYFYSVCYQMFDSSSGEWWEPWAMGAIYPFWCLYENAVPIIGMVVGLALLIGVPVLIVFISRGFAYLIGLFL